MTEQDFNRLMRELEKLNDTLAAIRDRMPVPATYTALMED
jgi:hypothetical protein